MARPLRRLYPIRGFERRRHRSWILSMTFATAALGVLAFCAVLRRFGAHDVPPLGLAAAVSSLFSVPGLFFGVMTLRGKPAWLAYAGVPIVANAVLLALPWVLWHIRGD
jgi:hypothetical protein